VPVGRGWTQPGGRPHAETQALAAAGEAARGATAYVTLEPCSHHGKTGPCAEALIVAGVSRVVAAIGDPDPRVSGRGFTLMRHAGITVDVGVMADEAADVTAGFLTRVTLGRPLVTLKLATSMDGRIATASGESQWITGPAARARGHLIRATSDAIMIGSGTALHDDPALTCRIPGLEDRSPVRVVMDGRLRLPVDSHLVRSARVTPVIVICGPDAPAARAKALEDCGVELMLCGTEPATALDTVGRRGITRLMVEGGGQLAAALVAADLVDRLVWFRAPLLIGGEGRPAVAGLGSDILAALPRFERRGVEAIGPDVMESYVRAR
jgi:diaminohydroxyphosphoribosylaminopyrimidine deaminase/5-amino-6-(5-phosphoribosylamino)uracil reductase